MAGPPHELGKIAKMGTNQSSRPARRQVQRFQERGFKQTQFVWWPRSFKVGFRYKINRETPLTLFDSEKPILFQVFALALSGSLFSVGACNNP